MTEEQHAITLDGNAEAGLLSEVFVRDVTVAVAICAGCGASRHSGTLPLYAQEIGAILRCAQCSGVVVRDRPHDNAPVARGSGSRCIAMPLAFDRTS